MKAIARLKRDHVVLRSKLDVLEAAMRLGPQSWYVLREMCFTLARQLRNHMQREEDLVLKCRSAMNPKALAEIAFEHRDEPEHLRRLNQLFVEQDGHTLERIRPILTEVIQGLRRHMAEEEREMFPILERELAAREPAAAQALPSSGVHLQEVMTVNEVLHVYPMSRAAFDELFIHVPYEGCDCLDEVAWRRGMDAQELLDRLERSALSGGRLPLSAVAGEKETCACR